MKKCKYIFLAISLFACFSCEQGEITDDQDLITQGANQYTDSEVSYQPSWYPEYSWDTVPVCIHLGDASGFTDDEVAFMSQFPLVCIEKSQGNTSVGNMQDGTLLDAGKIKALNADCRILFYMNAVIDYGGSFSKYGSVLYENDDDDTNDLEGQLFKPEWALLYDESYNSDNDGVDEDCYVLRNDRRTFNPSISEMRDWWISHVMEVVNEDVIDGVFVDALPTYICNESSTRTKWGDQYDDVQQGAFDMLDALLDTLDKKKMSIGNYLRGTGIMDDGGVRYFEHTDGAMMEHFTNISGYNADYIVEDIKLIEAAAEAGKIVVVKAWPRYVFTDTDAYAHLSQAELIEVAREDIVFPLAAFLAGAGEHAYFCYSWSYGADDGGLVDYEEYKKPLGAPLGKAVQNGYIFTRSFEHASIWVDVENRIGEITWKEEND